MPSLSVPLPNVKFATAIPSKLNLAVLEKPVEIHCGNVTFPNGQLFEQNQQQVAGFFIYRQQAGFVEIWDETAKQWKPDPGEALGALQPKPLAFKPGESEPWQGLFVPAGEKNPVFETKDRGFKYFFRAYFVSNEKTGSISGLSDPSVAVKFIGILDAIRAGINVGNKLPEDAEKIQLFLRNSDLKLIGSVEIISEGTSAKILVANNFNGAGIPQSFICLTSDGDVEIQSAPGKSVKVSGAIKGDRIFYQPADATGNAIGPKRWLS